MSSVPALNASPSSATERPATPPTAVVDPLGELLLVREVRLGGRRRDVHREPALATGDRDRLELLGQAAAAEPEARVEHRRPDPRVEADAVEDGAGVGPGTFREAGDLVGERDLEGEERVGARS